MSEPSEQDIERLKAQLPNKTLHRLDLDIAGEIIVLVMSGPGRMEYEKYRAEVDATTLIKSKTEKSKAVLEAIERAALAQIRWPDRAAAQELFEKFPALALSLDDKLHEFAGATVEVVAKKL